MSRSSSSSSSRERSPSSPPPQLAREVCTVDDSDSSGDFNDDGSDQESLEIIMPQKKTLTMKTELEPKKPKKQVKNEQEDAATNQNNEKKRKPLMGNDLDDDDDSSDDEKMKALLATNAGIGKKNNRVNLQSSSTPSSASTLTSSLPQKEEHTLRKRSPPPSDKDDDENAHKRRQAELARWQKKQVALQQKEAAKRVRAKEREEARKEKETEKVLLKKQKAQEKDLADQASGKFCHKEIVALVDSDLYNKTEYALVETFQEDFLLHKYESALTCKRTIQWIRKDHLQGGAERALQELEEGTDGSGATYEHLNQVMLILEADEFLPLLQNPDNQSRETKSGIDLEVDFPKLQAWLGKFIKRWKLIWKKTSNGTTKEQEEPRLLLLLYQIPEALDKLWVDHRRHSSKKQSGGSTSSPPTEWDFQDALHWLLIQHQVETVLCPTIESIQSNFHKMTRGLAEASYAEQVTELQCIKKIKGSCTCGNDDYAKANDVWIRQLQMLPGVSEPKARNLAQSYPTALSLWQTYHESVDAGEEHESTNRHLVAEEFSNGVRREMKLSESLYKVMTSDNPNEMIL